MLDGRQPDPSTRGRDAALVEFARDTWNAPAWIARHRAMSPGERIELAVVISRAALQFARAPRVSADDD
jgi:hypothetical protein